MFLKEILYHKGSNVHSIQPEASIRDVVNKMVECNCGSLVVVRDNELVGIITERDILKVVSEKHDSLSKVTVESHMSTNVITGTPEDSVSDTMGLLTEKRIRHLPILDEGKLAGMVSIGDVVKAQHHQIAMENDQLKQYIQS